MIVFIHVCVCVWMTEFAHYVHTTGDLCVPADSIIPRVVFGSDTS